MQDLPEEFKGQTDPYSIFKIWWDEAHKTTLKDANAFLLSTVDPSGQPQARVVLAKELRPNQGLVFYTNYLSAKGQDISKNPKVAATFFWDPLFRQVKVKGEVTRLSAEESLAYWRTRPRESQLTQSVSRQSQPLPSRAFLDQEVLAAQKTWERKDVPCPPHWGGYLISPRSIEFWIGRHGRSHDRLVFTKVGEEWNLQRLYP
jgi:pyridoxamine 5'-phosphate oxidase